LLSDILLNATMPQKAVAREREVQLAGIRDDDEQLTTVARNILRGALFGEHPYALRAKGTPEAVTQLTQEDLLAFRDRYVVAKNGVISVFGKSGAQKCENSWRQMLAGMNQGELA
jgi:zinc protease